MRQHNHTKTLLTLLLLLVGVGTMWGKTVTYTVTQYNAVTTTGTAPAGSSATFSNSSGNKEQLSSDYKMTLTLSGYEGQKITGISLSMKSNTSSGAGYLSMKVGNTVLASIGSSSSGVKFSNSLWNGSYSTTYKDVTPTLSSNSYIIKKGEKIVLVIGATENSLYCQSFTITYESGTTSSDSHIATFISNGETIQSNPVQEGEAITFPTDRGGINGKHFVGWTTTPINETTDEKPTLVPIATTMGTSDMTFYAVFATIEEQESWEEIKGEPKDGIYAICSNDYFMKASISSSRLSNGDSKPSITNGRLNQAPTPDCIWEISKPDNYFRIKNGEKYAGGTATKNQASLLNESSNNYAKWTISYSNNVFVITNYGRSSAENDSSKKYLRNYFSYGWATYESTTGAAPRLFKKTTSAAYSAYCTTVDKLPTLSLSEQNTTIEQVNGTYSQITVERSMKADVWNTFVMPFPMTSAQIQEKLGAGAKVMQLTSVDVQDNILEMGLSRVYEIQAGVPYMVSVKNAISEIVMEDEFSGIPVTTTDAPATTVTDEHGNSLTFHGNYAKKEVPMGSYIINSNAFYCVNSTVNNKGFRGYFTIETASGKEVKALSYGFDDSQTDISLMHMTGPDNSQLYDLQGRSIHKTQKNHLYIKNGRKYLAK